MRWFFKTPEKRTNPNDGTVVFDIHLQDPYRIDTCIDYDGYSYIPNIHFQSEIDKIRSSILPAVAETPTLFRTPPTLRSLQAITPVWGAVVQDEVLNWNHSGRRLPDPPKEWVGRSAVVSFLLVGIQITRSTILPIWSICEIAQVAEGPPPDLIDFHFDDGGCKSDTRSIVSSDDLSIEAAEEASVFELSDLAKEKQAAKLYVRELLRNSVAAHMAADDALERFLERYDLSEDESDFSDADD